MAHKIEEAKSGRARCRKCKQPIAKAELRFGEEVVNDFSDSGDMTYRWYHILCAAQARPKLLSAALDDFDGDIPDREALDNALAKGKSKQKPSSFPYGERAPSGRSKCLACGEKIEKGSLRVAIEREVDTGSFVTTSAGYLHPGCSVSHTGDDALLDKMKANSEALSADDLDQLEGELG